MKEQFNILVKNPAMIPIVSLISLGIGGAIGYFVGKRKAVAVDYSTIEKEHHEIPGQIMFPIDDMDTYIHSQNSKRDIEEVEEVVVPRIAPFVKPQQTVEDNIRMQQEAAKEPTSVKRSIFTGQEDEWDYEVEVPLREHEIPYIVHRDEFYGEEAGFDQTTFTYFSGDEIMVDQDDTPVYNFSTVVGELNFGHGSDDPNVFYVRNEIRHMEYEVIQDPGRYSVDILGLDGLEEIEEISDKELRHSLNGVRKFRLDD